MIDTLRTRLGRRWRRARVRLLGALLRSRHPPEHGARGVLVGLAAAMTPFLGVQMLMVLAWWGFVRRVRPQWDFNLLVGLAWTWVTNVVTMPLLLYLYVMTGRVVLGHWERIRDYDAFAAGLEAALGGGTGWLEQAMAWMEFVTERFAVPLAAGALPWMIAVPWLGHALTLRWLRRRERRRAARAAAAAER